jgi:hypothetical protein
MTHSASPHVFMQHNSSQPVESPMKLVDSARINVDPLYWREDMYAMNQRVLDPNSTNYYHVTRQDFTAPTLYSLNLLKTNNRVKVKTFLPK